MSPALLSALSFLRVSVFPCWGGSGFALVCSAPSRVARLALARRALLASGFALRVGPAWYFGAASKVPGASLCTPVAVAFRPSTQSQVSF